jgi:hypothetical protein
MKSILLGLLLLPQVLYTQIQVSKQPEKGKDFFTIVNKTSVANIYFDTTDYTLVNKSAHLLAADIERVSGKKPKVIMSEKELKGNIIIVGSVAKNKLINKLAAAHRINVDTIRGKWERFIIQTVKDPFPGISHALVIVGSDRRGTAYGVFTVSSEIGVSPWYWWADVPVQKSSELYFKTMSYISQPPSVKYRGIFINDEDWGLHPWAGKKFEPEVGDIGPKTYEKIFELLLRLKGNMIAPAMHECTKAFFTVPGNMEMADTYGIMMTSSHCEPLLYNNAHEWDKKKQGDWNYVTNKAKIVSVLDERVKQTAGNENIYTIALRGMHDEGMLGVTEDQKLKVLEEAANDQRKLLTKYINKPIDEIPQIFVPYKEVLSIYEKGMDLPDDITIVWPDDNYGYIKKLSNDKEQKRKGGAGVYYHISYLGWPNDYLWINTTPPALMYEELHKAYSLGANKYWLLNVGDIKPGELGMQLFLDMAWNFDKFNFENINQYQVKQLSKIFGQQHENDIAEILDRYYYHGFTRKPEYMTWDFRWNSLFTRDSIKDTDFSFINYNEAESRLNDYNAIATKAQDILQALPHEYKPAFFELVYYPVKGAALYNHEMLVAQKNRWYAKQSRFLTNALAKDVKLYHDSLATLTKQYNTILNGKWSGMMTAPGFLPREQLPPTKQLTLPASAEMGLFVEGQQSDTAQYLELPQFSVFFKPSYFIEVYNKGTQPVKWIATASEKWIKLSQTEGKTESQQRIYVSIDWQHVPYGDRINGKVNVTDGNNLKQVNVSVFNPEKPSLTDLSKLFLENDGVVTIDPSEFHRKTENGSIRFQVIEGLGYCNAALQLGNARFDSGEGSHADFDFYTFSYGWTTIYVYALPLFAKDKSHSTRYGVQIDDQEYQTCNNDVKEYSMDWANNVIRNSAIDTIKVFLDKPGKHTLKLFCEDPGMIIQKMVIDLGGLKKSYLGPAVTMKKEY